MVVIVCKVVVIVTTFATSGHFRYLVVVVIAKFCNCNYDHLRTCSNYSYGKVHKALFISPLQKVIVLLINGVFLRSLENKKLIFENFMQLYLPYATLKQNTITQVAVNSVVTTSVSVI